MRLRRTLCTAAVAALAVAGAAHADLRLPRPSPAATVKQTIGTSDFSIAYSRPAAKGRAIWGALVPLGEPWRTGANEATSFTASTDFTVAGKPLPAGTYALVTLPAAGEWTVIFSRQTDLMGTSNYDPAKDALRVTATPDTAQPHVESMSLGFEDLTANSGQLVLRWQRLRLAVPIGVDVNGIVLADCRREIAAAKAGDWRTAFSAARWCFDNSVALEEGQGWLQKSIGVEKTHANLALKARWLMKDGKKADAMAAAKEAIANGKASKDKVDTSGTEKLLAEWSAAK